MNTFVRSVCSKGITYADHIIAGQLRRLTNTYSGILFAVAPDQRCKEVIDR
jgi:hypothetical protein